MSKVSKAYDEKRAEVAQWKRFDSILATFESNFGKVNVRFELFEYANQLGVAVLHNSGRRIGFRFKRAGDNTELNAALTMAREWMQNPTTPPGVEENTMLEGNEVAAWLLKAA